MIGKPQHSLIHHSRPDGSPYPREECHIYAAFKDGVVHHVADEVFWRKDGSRFPVEYVSTPIIEEGQITGAVVAFQDISERKRMEELLIEKTRAAQIANKAKSEFLSNTSHEIRTPLNAITGFSKILLKMLKKKQINEKFEEFLNLIIKSGNNLSEVINNVLDLAKIESGKVRVHKIGFDLRIVIKSLIAIFKYQALEKGINLNYYFDFQIKNYVFSDRVKINQIITNLLSNAIKFTDSGDVILEVKKSNDLLLFSVTDTGIGIKAERLNSIFKEFEQVDSSTTWTNRGSGLGLSICKHLVELLGGNISAESQEGKGSRFTVTLPLEEIEVIKDEEEPMDDLVFSKENKVLLVEDNKENMLLAKTILNDLGIEPETAENGELAIEKAVKISPDLIFMDVQMPVMDGLEAAKRLRKNPQTKSIPIIGMSAHALSEHEMEGKIAGFTDYLTKPIDFQKFSKVCLKYLKSVSQDQDG